MTPQFHEARLVKRLRSPMTLLLLVASACGADQQPSEKAARSLIDPTRHPIHIGVESQESRDAAIGTVIAARVTESGDHVVVLDFAPPFVKVFRRNGTLRTAFGRSGGGAGELRGTAALAVAGDSLLLLADGAGRLMTFDLDGTLQNTALSPDVRVLAATSACGSDWVIYGPRRKESYGRGSWLHRLRFPASDSLVVTHAYTDSLASPLIPGGIAFGLVSDTTGSVAWHTLGENEQLIRWSCDDAEPSLAHQGKRAVHPVVNAAKGGGLQVTGRADGRFLAGAVSVSGGTVVGEGILTDGAASATELTYLPRGGTPQKVVLPGSFVLRDSRPGVGVLMSTSDPVPQVFLVPEPDILQLFR